MELYKEYKLRNGNIIILDSISIYDNTNLVPIDVYTSNTYHGAWNRKGKFLTNLYFLDGEPSEMDIIK